MRYLLSLCILFLSGLTQLSAHQHEAAQYARSGNLAASTHATFTSEQTNEAVPFNYLSSDSERKTRNDLADVAEVKAEEDELHFFTKYPQSKTLFAATFDAQSAIYFFHFLKNRTSLCKQLLYHSSYESITVTFGVFRL